MKKGILLIISGYSGAGKGTIVKQLLAQHEEYAISISATTRKPREGEVHGKDYFFISKEEFEGMIVRQELLEYAGYQDNYYGTPAAFVKQQLESGKHVILEIDSQGAANVRMLFPDCVLVFIVPPTVRELYRRLSGRGTETPEKVQGRMELAAGETERIPAYDYLVVNDNCDEAVDRVHEIVQCEMCKCSRQTEFAAQLKNEFDAFLKGE